MKMFFVSVLTLFFLVLFTKAPVFASTTQPVWTETQPAGATDQLWYASASSANGQVQIVGSVFHRLYLSTNGGASWSETQPAGDTDNLWSTLSMTPNGQIMLAGMEGGRLYLSINGGTTWAETRPNGDTDNVWDNTSISANGQIMLASEDGGRVYVTTNGGTSWTETQPLDNNGHKWSVNAMTADGSLMMMGAQVGRLFTSTNFGVSWVETQPFGSSTANWIIGNVSADGSTLFVGDDGIGGFISKDRGSSWVPITLPSNFNGNLITSGMSADGQTIMFGTFTSGRLYLSQDGGTTWGETQPVGDQDLDWTLSNVSGDGHRFLAGNEPGRLYEGVIPSVSVASSQTHSSPQAPTCGDLKPSSNPDLFQISTSRHQATLYFSPSSGTVNHYFITYGYSPGDMRFGTELTQGASSGVLSYTINDLTPSTNYYFMVRAGNGCMPGDWSNWLKAKTSSGSKKNFYK